MPPENRVWGDDRGDVAQRSPAQTLAAHGQPASFIIGQLEPTSTQLPAEDPILFDQVGHRLLLLAGQPAGQSGEKKPRGRDVNHSGSLHHRPRFGPPRPLGRVVEHYA